MRPGFDSLWGSIIFAVVAAHRLSPSLPCQSGIIFVSIAAPSSVRVRLTPPPKVNPPQVYFISTHFRFKNYGLQATIFLAAFGYDHTMLAIPVPVHLRKSSSIGLCSVAGLETTRERRVLYLFFVQLLMLPPVGRLPAPADPEASSVPC